MNKRNIRRLKTKIAFVEATAKIIEEETLEAVNARRIGDLALYNPATIYNYFQTLDHLIILASVKLIREYLQELLNIPAHLSPLESYLFMWEAYIRHTQKQPDLFYKFFFNTQGIPLDEVFNEYFEMYPDEMTKFPKSVETFIFAGDINTRNMNCIKGLYAHTNVGDEILEMLSFIHVGLAQSLTINTKNTPKYKKDEERQHFLDMLSFTMLLAKMRE